MSHTGRINAFLATRGEFLAVAILFIIKNTFMLRTIPKNRKEVELDILSFLKAYLLRQKDGLYMLVLLASPRWRWCPGEYLLVAYRI